MRKTCAIILDSYENKTQSYLCGCLSCGKYCECPCHASNQWPIKKRAKKAKEEADCRTELERP